MKKKIIASILFICALGVVWGGAYLLSLTPPFYWMDLPLILTTVIMVTTLLLGAFVILINNK